MELAGQHADLYRAVATRNPVIDLTTMLPNSDIAEWLVFPVDAILESLKTRKGRSSIGFFSFFLYFFLSLFFLFLFPPFLQLLLSLF